jgi:hypothetical protein
MHDADGFVSPLCLSVSTFAQCVAGSLCQSSEAAEQVALELGDKVHGWQHRPSPSIPWRPYHKLTEDCLSPVMMTHGLLPCISNCSSYKIKPCAQFHRSTKWWLCVCAFFSPLFFVITKDKSPKESSKIGNYDDGFSCGGVNNIYSPKTGHQL